jgi:hypothetical protein
MSCAPAGPIYKGQVINLYELNGMHFINITLNGIKSKLLIDTGASKSLLDISQADAYGFKYVLLGENKYVGLGGEQDIYVIYELEVEEFFIPFLGSNLNGVQNYFKNDGIQIIGVLGSDFLEKHGTTIDFKTNKLYLKKRD